MNYFIEPIKKFVADFLNVQKHFLKTLSHSPKTTYSNLSSHKILILQNFSLLKSDLNYIFNYLIAMYFFEFKL